MPCVLMGIESGEVEYSRPEERCRSISSLHPACFGSRRGLAARRAFLEHRLPGKTSDALKTAALFAGVRRKTEEKEWGDP